MNRQEIFFILTLALCLTLGILLHFSDFHIPIIIGPQV